MNIAEGLARDRNGGGANLEQICGFFAADVDATDEDGKAQLRHAARRGNTEDSQLLLMFWRLRLGEG